MQAVFYSAQFILKSGGAQVAQMSGSTETKLSGLDLYQSVYDSCCKWYKDNGTHQLNEVSVHLIALNKI